MSIGGDSNFDLGGFLGNVAGLLHVTEQSDYPRSVVNLEQIMGGPSDEDVRTLVERVRDKPLMEGRRRNLVVDREPSFSFIPGLVNDSTCLPVDCSHES